MINLKLATLARDILDTYVKQIVLLVCILVLTACSETTVVLPTPTATATPIPPTITPTATPTLTPTFVKGFADIDLGKYLFVEYWYSTDAQETIAGTCNSPQIDFPSYTFDGEKRRLTGSFNWEQAQSSNSVKGFFGRGTSLHGKAGGGSASILEPIISLPHSTYPYHLTINGVNKDGSIVIEIEGHIETLELGKTWYKSVTSEATPGCQKTATERFTNYGLLEKSQIDLAWSK